MLRYSIYPIVIIIFLGSCKIDNYRPPNGGIHGKLLDKITGENLETQQPNGFSVQLFEKGGSINSPITILGKADGTFENSFIFQNEYKVLPTQGAFFPVDTLTIQIGSNSEANFEVMPFLAVSNTAVTASSGKITANYEIVRSQGEDKIVERQTLVSEIPTVNNVLFDFKSQENLSGVPDDEILSSHYSDVVEGLTPGKLYYVRIAVRTNNKLNKYNYSKVFQIIVP
jgi:hypothetical protein